MKNFNLFPIFKFSAIALATSLALLGCTALDSIKGEQAVAVVKPTEQSVKAEQSYRSTTQIMDESPASDWYTLDQDNLIYFNLDNGKQFIIELAPKIFAPEHIAQIKLLTQKGYWDGLTIYRVQDNYVAQFGSFDFYTDKSTREMPKEAKKLPAEFAIPADKVKLTELGDPDAYSDKIGFVEGFPVAVKDNEAFLVHCYGIVGAGRDMAPDSSNGNELYAMIGQPARALDRQITVVGRVVQGIEHLSSLHRGSGTMGFYNDKDPKPVVMTDVKLGSQLPKDKQVALESIKSDSKTFADIIKARRHIQSEWHIKGKSSGGMGLCDVRPPIRVKK